MRHLHATKKFNKLHCFLLGHDLEVFAIGRFTINRGSTTTWRTELRCCKRCDYSEGNLGPYDSITCHGDFEFISKPCNYKKA